MNVSLDWLSAIVGAKLDAQAVSERLAERGAPVEHEVHLGAGLEDVLVGRVTTVQPHPTADSLSICDVEAGALRARVVCGAQNVRAGSLYPFAPEGVALPDGTRIRKVEIRGQESVGMLCSALELGLGSDHSGLLELPADAPAGAPLVDVLGLDDWWLDVEVTANRGDLLSHLGVARELAEAGDPVLELPPVPGARTISLELCSEPRRVEASGVSVEIDEPELCHRYLGAVVRGVRVGPSPAWLRARLEAAGARAINNVVDATNYVLLELGQPLHAFDLGRLRGEGIVVRRPAEGESRFRTLDGEERQLTSEMLMICDLERPVAIAGVMGGSECEVDEETTDVLLECAFFEPRTIRATRTALNLSTDASYRFERGIDPAGLERATRRALEIIVAVAGGEVSHEVADCNPRPWEPFSVTLRLSRVGRVLGVSFTADQVRELLAPLGFGVSNAQREPVLLVAVPGYRSYDVTREIDLVEEIARAHGYDDFPSELRAYRPSTVPDHALFKLEDELRHMLSERGFFEAQTPAFVPEGEGEVAVQNPVSSEESYLRSAVLPSLVRSVERNFARGQGDVRLFEMATSFGSAGDGELPPEEPHLACVLTGNRDPGHWSDHDRPVDLWDLKGLLEEVVGRVGMAVEVRPGAPDDSIIEPEEGFAVLGPDEAVVGWAGRVASRAVKAPPWAGPVFGFELRLPRDPSTPDPSFLALPQFPAVDRDLALLVPSAVPAARIADVLAANGGELLSEVRLFDVYRGPGVPVGHRSLAYRLRFQSHERTLTDAEVDGVVSRLTRSLLDEHGVGVRG